MSAPGKINYKFYQGATVNEVLRWESTDKVYKPITAITKAAPVVITAVAHGLPIGWRTKVTSVLGMTDINDITNYYRVSAITTNTVTIDTINSLGFKEYISGGVLEYNKPIDLNGYTARMVIKAKATDPNILYEADTTNGNIIISDINKTITINIPASITDTFNFTTAYYLLEVYSNNGEVIPFTTGNISIVKG